MNYKKKDLALCVDLDNKHCVIVLDKIKRNNQNLVNHKN